MKTSPSTYTLTFPIDHQHYELLLAKLSANGLAGCEELNGPAGLSIRCFFIDPQSAALARAIIIKSGVDHSLITSDTIAHQDWNANWRKSIKPIMIAPRLYASPSWLIKKVPRGNRILIIEPEMAFGTGHHETTRLATAALQSIQANLKIKNSTVVDIGCGSAVLCLAAALFGAKRCIGFDLDLLCSENIAKNRRLNKKIGKNVVGYIGSIDALSARVKADAVVMNMIVLESDPLIKRAVSLLKSGGFIIRSGILIEERKKVIAMMKRLHCVCIQETVENEWWCAVFQKS